jgi:hypothetical protein
MAGATQGGKVDEQSNKTADGGGLRAQAGNADQVETMIKAIRGSHIRLPRMIGMLAAMDAMCRVESGLRWWLRVGVGRGASRRVGVVFAPDVDPLKRVQMGLIAEIVN